MSVSVPRSLHLAGTYRVSHVLLYVQTDSLYCHQNMWNWPKDSPRMNTTSGLCIKSEVWNALSICHSLKGRIEFCTLECSIHSYVHCVQHRPKYRVNMPSKPWLKPWVPYHWWVMGVHVVGEHCHTLVVCQTCDGPCCTVDSFIGIKLNRKYNLRVWIGFYQDMHGGLSQMSRVLSSPPSFTFAEVWKTGPSHANLQVRPKARSRDRVMDTQGMRSRTESLDRLMSCQYVWVWRKPPKEVPSKVGPQWATALMEQLKRQLIHDKCIVHTHCHNSHPWKGVEARDQKTHCTDKTASTFKVTSTVSNSHIQSPSQFIKPVAKPAPQQVSVSQKHGLQWLCRAIHHFKVSVVNMQCGPGTLQQHYVVHQELIVEHQAQQGSNKGNQAPSTGYELHTSELPEKSFDLKHFFGTPTTQDVNILAACVEHIQIYTVKWSQNFSSLLLS